MNTYTILVEVAIKIEANSSKEARSLFGDMDWSMQAFGSPHDHTFVDYYVVDDDEEEETHDPVTQDFTITPNLNPEP